MQTRLQRELISLQQQQQLDGIHVYTDTDDIHQLTAKIIGPPDTPYHNGIYTLSIRIPDRYPFQPPLIKFVTKIYHPNIDVHGRICLDILKLPPTGSWKPSLNISSVLISVRVLMGTPNPDDPLDSDIAKMWLNDRVEYTRIACEWNDKYACNESRIYETNEKVEVLEKVEENVVQNVEDTKKVEEIKRDEKVDAVKPKRMRLNLTTKKR